MDKGVVRCVAIKLVDDIVPVPPGLWIWFILVCAVGISLSGYIEPVCPPPLAIVLRVEQFHDHALKPVRSL